jgi:1,4-dihydroxy-2-naphthoate octaprenyltransferase
LRKPKPAVRIESMKSRFTHSKLVIFFLSSRPKFLVASAAPVLVGSAAGYAASGTFQPVLFIMALFAIMSLHSGANITNDYFDHISGNDWVNKNPTPFSGGRRFIQNGVLSPKETLLTAALFFAIGSAIGIVIVSLTRSIFILVLGLAGLLGGFFYTARPIQLGYRCIGELVIALLFGLLPVYGSYYLQSGTTDAIVVLPASIISILIFLVILVNEFPDRLADAQVYKRTLVVRLGVPHCVWIYRAMLTASFIIAIAMLAYNLMFYAGLFYLFTAPLAYLAMKLVNKEDLIKPGYYRASQITVLLHTVGALALTVGFLIGYLA